MWKLVVYKQPWLKLVRVSDSIELLKLSLSEKRKEGYDGIIFKN